MPALFLPLFLVGALFGPAPADPSFDPSAVATNDEVAVAREFQIRRWALALSASTARSGGDGELDEWSAAVQASDWRVRRAALHALRRAPELADEALGRRAARSGLFDSHPSVVEAALVAMQRRGWFDLLVVTSSALEADAIRAANRARLVELTTEPLPGVRMALAHAAARPPAPVVQVSAAAGSLDAGPSLAQQDASFQLRLGVLERLIDDRDPGVRGTARSALFHFELPLALLAASPEVDPESAHGRQLAAQVQLLHRLVTEERFEELVASLELLSRALPEPRAAEALSAWASADAEALSVGLDLDERIVRGLVEAVLLGRGDRGNGPLVARAFADWILVRTWSELELDLSSWSVVENLLTAGAESPGDQVAFALLDESRRSLLESMGATETMRPGSQSGATSWSQAQAAPFAGEVSLEDFQRALFARVVGGRAPEKALELFVTRGFLSQQADWFLEQFSRGLVAGDLYGLDELLGLRGTRRLGYRVTYGSRGPQAGALTALVENLALGHSQAPDAATEELLLESLNSLYLTPETRSFEEQRFAIAFRALCAARYVDGTELGPAGLLPAEEFFRRTHASIRALWQESEGLRLDLLTKLPRLPAMEAFVPELLIVGNAGGVGASYRVTCVELLGACRGDERVADTLEAWLAEELAARPGQAPLLRVDELELAGLASAIAANGAELGRGEAEVEALLELALARGRSGLAAKELGKAAIVGLLRYPDGLARLDARFLGDAGEDLDRRLRIEAALQILGATDAPEPVARATRRLIADFDGVGWDLAPRLTAALGASDGTGALEFLVAELERSLGPEAPVEAVSLLDAMVARARRVPGDRAVVLRALAKVLADGRSLELRAAAIDRIGALLAALRGEADEAQSAVVLERDALVQLLFTFAFEPRDAALAERAGLSILAAPELGFLSDRALEALALILEEEPRLAAVVFDAAMTSGREQLEQRWRGGTPRGAEFATRTALAVFHARGSFGARAALLDAVPGWEACDGRFLDRLAQAALDGSLSRDPGLGARLSDAALVALEGEPELDHEVWAATAARRLALAWQAGDWARAGSLADELSWRLRRGEVLVTDLRSVFGTRDPGRGVDPEARIESLRFQAAAHLTAEPEVFARRAEQLIGVSTAAAADQSEL